MQSWNVEWSEGGREQTEDEINLRPMTSFAIKEVICKAIRGENFGNVTMPERLRWTDQNLRRFLNHKGKNHDLFVAETRHRHVPDLHIRQNTHHIDKTLCPPVVIRCDDHHWRVPGLICEAFVLT